jgi:hypothetical protein
VVLRLRSSECRSINGIASKDFPQPSHVWTLGIFVAKKQSIASLLNFQIAFRKTESGTQTEMLGFAQAFHHQEGWLLKHVSQYTPP